MRFITANELPGWVNALMAERPFRDEPKFWAVDESGDYHALAEMGTFHRRDLKGKAPAGVDPDDVVGWYDLPAWVKGSYSTEAEMLRLQSLTWIRGNLSGSTYFAYDEKGKYVGLWERE